MFSGSDADIVADFRALRDRGVAGLDIDFGGHGGVEPMLAEMRRFRAAVIDKV